ncbi:MAG TPA: polynucleotide kinase-phosphatase, partial [Ktedonobacterales bacterium]|nr:polynucleotide kinase-phosphatase [Ktedonobacterales bacterium]
TTRLMGNLTIEAGNAAAALEVMSRFALDPRWLIYLPPTMSPSETTALPGLLEHPAEALAYYRAHGVARVICEEKHMGSRAVLILCRDEATARRRFGSTTDAIGACYTRTGRRFFDDDALDRAFFEHCVATLTATGFWERFMTDWVCLDTEIMPWSMKAQGLLRTQYAPVAAAGCTALSATQTALSAAIARGLPLEELQASVDAHQDAITRYAEAYGRYCWETEGLSGVRVAPFHVLATEGKTYTDRDHGWHMSALDAEIQADPPSGFMATRHCVVALDDEAACTDAVAWWEEMTANGGEGMVVKPFDYIAHHGRSLLQPAVKCRGREYLRIIYGPTYTLPENLERLRKRGLGAKRALALREFALGVESLERFVAGEPLWRVHQAVFGVLALESEPVDPRL